MAFTSKYVSSSNGEFNPTLKQRGYAITSEYGGPLDTAEWSLTYPGDDWPNIYPGKLVYVFDEDEYYYADSNLVWHQIGDLVGEDIGNDDVYFDIDFDVTGGTLDKYGHTWVFNHNSPFLVTPHLGVKIGGKAVRLANAGIEDVSIGDMPQNSEIRTCAPIVLGRANNPRARRTNDPSEGNYGPGTVRAGVIPYTIRTEDGLTVTGRLKYAINPEGSEDTYQKFIEDVSSRILYLHPDTPELQKGFLIASESGGALDVTGYTGMPTAEFTNKDKGLKPWDRKGVLTNMYLGKIVYNYDPQAPENSSMFRYSYNVGNNIGADAGKRFDVNFYEKSISIEHNARIKNWEYHNPFLLDFQHTTASSVDNFTASTNLNGSGGSDVYYKRFQDPANFVAPNWVKFEANKNKRGKIRNYRVNLSFGNVKNHQTYTGYAFVNLSKSPVNTGQILSYYQWTAYNKGHGTTVGSVIGMGATQAFLEVRYVKAELQAEIQSPNSANWTTVTLVQDDSRFKWTGSTRYVSDDSANHPTQWNDWDNKSFTSTGSVFFESNFSGIQKVNWMSNPTFLRKFIDFDIALNSDIPGVGGLTYVKNTKLRVEMEPMFSNTLMQMSQTEDFSATPSQLFGSGTRGHSTMRVYFRLIPKLKETGALVPEPKESTIKATSIEAPSGMAKPELKRKSANLYYVDIDTFNLTGAAVNWKIHLSGRYNDDLTGIPGGDTVNTSFTVTVSAKPLALKVRFYSDYNLTTEVFEISRKSIDNKISSVYATLWDGDVRVSEVSKVDISSEGNAFTVLDAAKMDIPDSKGIATVTVSPKSGTMSSERTGNITVTLKDNVSGQAKSGTLPVKVTPANFTMQFRAYADAELTQPVTEWLVKNSFQQYISNIQQWPDCVNGIDSWGARHEIYVVASVVNDDNKNDRSDSHAPDGESANYWKITTNDFHRNPNTNLSASKTFTVNSDRYNKSETITATWKSYTPKWEAMVYPELTGEQAQPGEWEPYLILVRDLKDPDTGWHGNDGNDRTDNFKDYADQVDTVLYFRFLNYDWEISGAGASIQEEPQYPNHRKTNPNVGIILPSFDREQEDEIVLGCNVKIRHYAAADATYDETVFDDTRRYIGGKQTAHPDDVIPTDGYFSYIDNTSGDGISRNGHILFFPPSYAGYMSGGVSGFSTRLTVTGSNMNLATDEDIISWFSSGTWSQWDFDGIESRNNGSVVIKVSTKSSYTPSDSRNWTFKIASTNKGCRIVTTAVKPGQPVIFTPWVYLDGNKKWKSNSGWQSQNGYSYDSGYRFVLRDWHHLMNMSVAVASGGSDQHPAWSGVRNYMGVAAAGNYTRGGAWIANDGGGQFTNIGACELNDSKVTFRCTLPNRGVTGNNIADVWSNAVDWRYWIITPDTFNTYLIFSKNNEYTWHVQSVDEYHAGGHFDVSFTADNTTSRTGLDPQWWTAEVYFTGNGRIPTQDKYRKINFMLAPDSAHSIYSGTAKNMPQMTVTPLVDCQSGEYYRPWFGHPICRNATLEWPTSYSPGLWSEYFLSQSANERQFEYPVIRDALTPAYEPRISSLPYGYRSFSTGSSQDPQVQAVEYSIMSCSNLDLEVPAKTGGARPETRSEVTSSNSSIKLGWTDARYLGPYYEYDSKLRGSEWKHVSVSGTPAAPRGVVEFATDWVRVDIYINMGTMDVPAWATSTSKQAPYCTFSPANGTNHKVTPYYGCTEWETVNGIEQPKGGLAAADMTWSLTDRTYFDMIYSDPTKRVVLPNSDTKLRSSAGSGFKIVERSAPEVSHPAAGSSLLHLSYYVKPNPNIGRTVTPTGNPNYTQYLKTQVDEWEFKIKLSDTKSVTATAHIPIYMKQVGSGQFSVGQAKATDSKVEVEVTADTMIVTGDDIKNCRNYLETAQPQVPKGPGAYNSGVSVPAGGFIALTFLIDGKSARNSGTNGFNQKDTTAWQKTTVSGVNKYKKKFVLSKGTGSGDALNSGSHTLSAVFTVVDAAGNAQSVYQVDQAFSCGSSPWQTDATWKVRADAFGSRLNI